MMMHADACDIAFSMLTSEDFYDEAHATLFSVFAKIRKSGKPIDANLIVDELKRQGKYESIGGVAYLGKVLHSVNNHAHTQYYAEIVADKSMRRNVITASLDTLKDAYDSDDEAIRIVGKGESRLEKIADSAKSVDTVVSVSTTVEKVQDLIERRLLGEAEAGVKFGYSELDKLTGGARPNELIILAARPSMGKTALAMNIAINVCREPDKSVLFVSLEMGQLDLTERCLADVSKVQLNKLRDGTLTPQDREDIAIGSGTLANMNLFIEDSPSRTVTEISAIARRVKRKSDLSMVVIDYLQLIEPSDRKSPRQEQVAGISRDLKRMSKELKLPVVCLAQLNRQADSKGQGDKLPALSDLRESGAIEQDADVVLFIHRPAYYKQELPPANAGEEAKLVIAKQRNGATGVINLQWFRRYCRFENAAEGFHERNSYEHYTPTPHAEFEAFQ